MSRHCYYVMSCHVMSCYIMLCYIMLCYAMLCYAMLCYVCYVMLCYVYYNYYVMLCLLCYFMLCYVCYVMLCYVMLCCVVLCSVVLCCVVLYYVMLTSLNFWSFNLTDFQALSSIFSPCVNNYISYLARECLVQIPNLGLSFLFVWLKLCPLVGTVSQHRRTRRVASLHLSASVLLQWVPINSKMGTTASVWRWSPIQVLTRLTGLNFRAGLSPVAALGYNPIKFAAVFSQSPWNLFSPSCRVMCQHFVSQSLPFPSLLELLLISHF